MVELQRGGLTSPPRTCRAESKGTCDWASWLQLESGRFGGFDVPYAVDDVVNDLLENFCGHRRLDRAYFVPYTFNYYLIDYPPPRNFWFDEVSVQGWQNEKLLIIEGVWFHDTWRGIIDDEYRASAHSYAGRFNEEYDKIKDKDSWDFEIYDFAYHYVEVGLMACLDYALSRNIPVVIYP